jgi:hypothetical protein
MNSCPERYEYSIQGGDVILTIPQSVKHMGHIPTGFLVACLIGYNSLIKKKTKFSSYIRKFRRDRVQRLILYEEGLPFIYRRKCANLSLYMRIPSVIYYFATDPSEFPYI